MPSDHSLFEGFVGVDRGFDPQLYSMLPWKEDQASFFLQKKHSERPPTYLWPQVQGVSSLLACLPPFAACMRRMHGLRLLLCAAAGPERQGIQEGYLVKNEQQLIEFAIHILFICISSINLTTSYLTSYF